MSIILPGDLITMDRHPFSDKLLLATSITIDPVIDNIVQRGTWLWDGEVVEVPGEVCIALAHLDILHDGCTAIYVLDPQGIGWADTSEVKLL